MKKRMDTDYRVIGHRVIDGDTIEGWIVVSPGVAIRERVRLRGIEGGELGTIEGTRAKHLLTLTLDAPGSTPLRLRSTLESRDNHGRLVADFTLATGESLCETLLRSGQYWRRDAYKPDPDQTKK